MTDTSHITDADIEQAIEQHDDPDHEDANTVDDIRTLLAIIQRGVEESWMGRMRELETGNAELIADHDDVVVIATGEIDTALEELEHHPDVDIDQITRDVVSATMHNAARRLSDYDWSHVYPLVARKPESRAAGEVYVEGVVNGLQATYDLSPGQAWAYYGVAIKGNSQSSWGRRKGDYDNKNVSDALAKARAKIPHE
jgi:hypothetical protein